MPLTQEEYNAAMLKLSYNGFDDVLEIIDQLQNDVEMYRRAARLYEEASNTWMERALKAEAKCL